MEILGEMFSLRASVKNMMTAYISYIRCILEQSCVIWHRTLPEASKEDLEILQRHAFRNILQDKYTD